MAGDQKTFPEDLRIVTGLERLQIHFCAPGFVKCKCQPFPIRRQRGTGSEKVCSTEEPPATSRQIYDPDVSVRFVFDLYEARVGERYKTTVA